MLTHEFLATAPDFCSKFFICRGAQQDLSSLLLGLPSAALLLSGVWEGSAAPHGSVILELHCSE